MGKLTGILIALVLIIGIGYWYWSRHHASTTNSTTSQSTDMNAAGNTGSTAENAVAIRDMAFGPANITVSAGTTVTWTNNDSVAHTVVETDGKTGPQSSSIPPSGTYSFTYATAGSFAYHCSIHPSMTGTVTVTP